MAMERVQRELGDSDRSAYFVAVLALAWPDGHAEMFRGEVRAGSSGRRAATAVSAMTRCSCPRAAR